MSCAYLWCNRICGATKFVVQQNLWCNRICGVTEFVVQQNLWCNKIHPVENSELFFKLKVNLELFFGEEN
jgi:hypothetical protein